MGTLGTEGPFLLRDNYHVNCLVNITHIYLFHVFISKAQNSQNNVLINPCVNFFILWYLVDFLKLHSPDLWLQWEIKHLAEKLLLIAKCVGRDESLVVRTPVQTSRPKLELSHLAVIVILLLNASHPAAAEGSARGAGKHPIQFAYLPNVEQTQFELNYFSVQIQSSVLIFTIICAVYLVLTSELGLQNQNIWINSVS